MNMDDGTAHLECNCNSSNYKYEACGHIRDWEKTVHEYIDERVRFLKQRRLNKRKKQVLIIRNKVHLDSLNSLHEKYVLVPADKAASNVIVVCKKYYLDVVIKELNSTKTYVKVNNESVNVVSRHLDYMVKNGVDVSPAQEELPSFLLIA